MMYFWDDTANNADMREGQMWWLGNGAPKAEGFVMTFQADGHELQMILNAMQFARIGKSGNVVFDRDHRDAK